MALPFSDIPSHYPAAVVADHCHRRSAAKRRSAAFFDIIYITTQGGPGNASNTLNIYGFRVGFEFFNVGYASALMITLSAIVLAAVLMLNRMRNAVAW